MAVVVGVEVAVEVVMAVLAQCGPGVVIVIEVMVCVEEVAGRTEALW